MFCDDLMVCVNIVCWINFISCRRIQVCIVIIYMLTVFVEGVLYMIDRQDVMAW